MVTIGMSGQCNEPASDIFLQVGFEGVLKAANCKLDRKGSSKTCFFLLRRAIKPTAITSIRLNIAKDFVFSSK
jgi:hypothetical protein